MEHFKEKQMMKKKIKLLSLKTNEKIDKYINTIISGSIYSVSKSIKK